MKPAPAGALGTIKLSSAVMADGQALPAGTYTVRTSDAAVTPVTGQSPDGSVWVEFVQGGAVKGRELATVLPDAASVKAVAKSPPPADGASRVDMLGGTPYVPRVDQPRRQELPDSSHRLALVQRARALRARALLAAGDAGLQPGVSVRSNRHSAAERHDPDGRLSLADRAGEAARLAVWPSRAASIGPCGCHRRTSGRPACSRSRRWVRSARRRTACEARSGRSRQAGRRKRWSPRWT